MPMWTQQRKLTQAIRVVMRRYAQARSRCSNRPCVTVTTFSDEPGMTPVAPGERVWVRWTRDSGYVRYRKVAMTLLQRAHVIRYLYTIGLIRN